MAEEAIGLVKALNWDVQKGVNWVYQNNEVKDQ